jgi:hypothetical protein
MAYNYLIPRLTSILPGYSCSATLFRAGDIIKRLREPNGKINVGVRVYHEGEVIHEHLDTVEIREGEVVSGDPKPFVWDGSTIDLGENPAFVEEDIRATDGEPLFISKFNQPSYAHHWAPRRKAIFTNLSQKFVDPRVIKWVGIYGRFLDTCSTNWVDRERDYGESVLFVNPWASPIVIKINAEGGRSIRGIKVQPKSVRRISLEQLLRKDETKWMGQIQITANNRIVSTSCKHSLSDPTYITDIEHFDPYRADPTHMPAFQMLRLRFGLALSNRGINMKRLRT